MAEWLAFMIFVWEAYCSDVNLETSYYDWCFFMVFP
jgi:hypothetical protein